MNLATNIAEYLKRIAGHPVSAICGLVLLCLVTYLPGVMRLPVVDRTEAVWAETSRDMVQRGAWFDPRYAGDVHAFRPVGTNWAQGISASLAGPDRARDIVAYRWPGLIAVTLSVLALYWLAAPLFGSQVAFLASALFAVAPLTVLVSQLAIAEGLSLLPAAIAMLALLRIYCAKLDDDTRVLAFAFWAAFGAGILINALLVPILAGVTLAALWGMHRDTTWYRRLIEPKTALLGLAIGAPWLMVRVYQDGIPFSGIGWRDSLDALGGSQDMKLRALPGTFLLAATLGFLPGVALLIPALQKSWASRNDAAVRFLCAWIVGYLVYLELVSSKPGTYMVQPMFPAMALIVASFVVRDDEQPLPRGHLLTWPVVAPLFAVVPYIALYWFTREWPSPLSLGMIVVTATLFYASAREGLVGRLWNWATTGIAALSLFAVTLLAVALPGIDKIWPANQLKKVIQSCHVQNPVGIIGFREPSIRFSLGADTSAQDVETVLNRKPPITIIERRAIESYGAALKKHGRQLSLPYTCAWSYNLMRGCNVSFLVAGSGEAATCFQNEEAACETPDIVPDANHDCG